LGIESDELEGGFRTRSAELADDSSTRGFIEIFLFDTTSGGAGFSLKAWEEFDEVLQEARKILGACSCDTACHNCLRAYQNRHLHDILNRHQGLVLLEYATTGQAPELEEQKVNAMVDQLERSLKLQNSDIDIVRPVSVNDAWEIKLNGSSLSFGVRSCLRDPRAYDSPELDEDYSDFELTSKLPEVAYEITDRLE
jgi:Distinct helicase family with a unique C-terminal domain including a metal-binding cysteine cluster